MLLKENSNLDHIQITWKNETKSFLQKEQERIHLNENAVRLLNPENVLKRGFTLTLKNGKIVKSVTEVDLDEAIETRFADGNVKSKIISK